MSLLIGPPGAGKTLLLKRLQDEEGEMPATISTVGTNMTNVQVTRKREVTVRELGGCMGPIWRNYYDDNPAIMYMVDISNPQQVSAASMQFIDLLNDDKTSKVKILLIFNKCELCSAEEKQEYQYLFMLEEILKHARQEVVVQETSVFSKEGLKEVREWLEMSAAG